MAIANSMIWMGREGVNELSGGAGTATNVSAVPGGVNYIYTPLGNPITAGDVRNAVHAYETQLHHAKTSLAQQLATDNHNKILAASAQWLDPRSVENDFDISLRNLRYKKKLLLCKGN